MKRPDFNTIVAQKNAAFQGKTVVLTSDDPTGVGFYGEEGMKADVRRISASPDEDMEGFEIVLDFGAHREHNINFEKAEWNGRDAQGRHQLVTATEGGYDRDVVTIGLDEADLEAYMVLADPSPVYDAWKESGTDQPYVTWLENIAFQALDLSPISDTPEP